MSVLANVVLLGWIPVVLVLFAALPARRAVLAAFIAGWLLLPVAGYKISGLPDYTKLSATCVGVLLGVALFAPDRLLSFRPSWLDLPMIIWCVVPLASSMTNGLGTYDGLSGVLSQTVTWGLPYFIGRIYLTDAAALRGLTFAIIVGGLVYVPLCLYELRMSPQLHRIFYGFHPSHFSHTLRYGGYRPLVFMQTGLMVGMWMATATVIAAWMSTTGVHRQLLRYRMPAAAVILLVTTVLCKSIGALLLLAVGLAALVGMRRFKSTVTIAILAVLPVGYVLARSSGSWSGAELVSLINAADEERAASLECRLVNEKMLIDKALRRPLFGWGGWGRGRVYDAQSGKDISITDGLWIIVLGMHGAVGLSALMAVLLLPSLVLAWRLPRGAYRQPLGVAGGALAVVLVLYAIDNLFNAMVNPIYMLMAGAVTTFNVVLARGLGRGSALPALRMESRHARDRGFQGAAGLGTR